MIHGSYKVQVLCTDDILDSELGVHLAAGTCTYVGIHGHIMAVTDSVMWGGSVPYRIAENSESLNSDVLRLLRSLKSLQRLKGGMTFALTNCRALGVLRLLGKQPRQQRFHHPDPFNPKVTKGWQAALKVS